MSTHGTDAQGQRPVTDPRDPLEALQQWSHDVQIVLTAARWDVVVGAHHVARTRLNDLVHDLVDLQVALVAAAAASPRPDHLSQVVELMRRRAPNVEFVRLPDEIRVPVRSRHGCYVCIDRLSTTTFGLAVVDPSCRDPDDRVLAMDGPLASVEETVTRALDMAFHGDDNRFGSAL